MTKYLFIITALFMFSATACAQVDNKKMISNDEFRKLIKSTPSTIVLDVRTAEEVNGPLSKIENAIHIPVQELSRRINELEQYKDEEIIIICRTQNRSSAAVDILIRNGFKAKCVNGGMTEYSAKAKKE
jgi:rhodanese-related sulfurtransferase